MSVARRAPVAGRVDHPTDPVEFLAQTPAASQGVAF